MCTFCMQMTFTGTLAQCQILKHAALIKDVETIAHLFLPTIKPDLKYFLKHRSCLLTRIRQSSSSALASSD